MSEMDMRGWKDLDARTEGTGHPAGDIDTLQLFGGQRQTTEHVKTLGCCDGFTNEASCWCW